MARRLRQIFRPVYVGGGFEIRPQRWWSRSQRRASALAAKVLEHSADEIAEAKEDARRLALDRALYGTAFVDSEGNRIDPGLLGYEFPAATSEQQEAESGS